MVCRFTEPKNLKRETPDLFYRKLTIPDLRMRSMESMESFQSCFVKFSQPMDIVSMHCQWVY